MLINLFGGKHTNLLMMLIMVNHTQTAKHILLLFAQEFKFLVFVGRADKHFLGSEVLQLLVHFRTFQLEMVHLSLEPNVAEA